MSIRQTSLLGFVKSTSSISCVGAESNALVDSNTGKPSRCTSGIEYFGAEDGKSSTGEPSRPSCATPLVPQEQQCTGDWCSACRIALERISVCLNFQIFLGGGGMPPNPHREAAICSPTSLASQNEIASYAYVNTWLVKNLQYVLTTFDSTLSCSSVALLASTVD